MNHLVKKNILGIGVTDASEKEILEYVFEFLEKSKDSLSIVTPNPEMVMYSLRHESFRKVLNDADVALCDGAGLFQAGKVLGHPLKQRIAGTDFMEKLCKESVRMGATVGFLGGRNRVAEKTSDCLVKKYPGLKVAFVGEEWLEESNLSSQKHGTTQNPTRNHAEAKDLPNTKYQIPDTIDILFVAYGHPKQEEWMAEHSGKIPVRVMMGVGGAFDYFSGEVSRAPKPIRDLGLEWLYRLLRQPWRLRRQLALPQFALLVLKEKFRQSSH
jgi:N-acetylglucosaminyldiphosphoundecaprenol N-acetyl-beta-D-mannosaminyltransferase